VAYAEPGRDISNRPGRFRRKLLNRGLAPLERVTVERFRRRQGSLDDIEGLCRGPACHQLAPQTEGFRPRSQQIHNPTPQRCRSEPESGPTADRGGDDPHAERLALRLVDDRPVMRADEEAFLCEQNRAFSDRSLPDRVAEDDGRNSRLGGGDTLTNPGDTTPREPDQLHEPARLTTNAARHVLEHGSTVLPPPSERGPCRN